MCAGAIHSPAILQRSGIGPGEWLGPLGIKVVADRPVGKHLLDHPILSVLLDLREGFQASTLAHRHTNCCIRYSSGLAGAGINDMIVIAGNLPMARRKNVIDVLEAIELPTTGKRFVLPHEPHLRPAWMIRAGLFLYDHLARRDWLPGSRGIDLRRHPAGAPLRPDLVRGFEYSDGWTDDARLVLACVRDAAEHGAEVRTRTACIAAARNTQHWLATLRNADGSQTRVQARALVNAAGPWAHQVLAEVLGERHAPPLRLVRGSHIVVRAVFAHPYAYIFQNPDGRIVFAIPYERDFTLIGTTEVEVHDPAAARSSADEEAYLLAAASRYFAQPIAADSVVHRYGGVRPLIDEAGDASRVSRDYRLAFDHEGAPVLTVFGGKITTFRRLAEEALDLLAPALGCTAPAWTQQGYLPGGDLQIGRASCRERV